jgi:PadR family transcriptional regulator, regulatory protein AphA
VPTLSPLSYLVLGLIGRAGEITPYELKRSAATVSGLWTLRHDQVYRETERLAAQGLLEEERETGGRRRRTFRITPAGRRALERWLAQPTAQFTELRDPGLLQLFLGAEPDVLGGLQLAAHEERLRDYEQLAASLPPHTPDGARLSLQAGIAHEREWVRFWRGVQRAPRR